MKAAAAVGKVRVSSKTLHRIRPGGKGHVTVCDARPVVVIFLQPPESETHVGCVPCLTTL